MESKELISKIILHPGLPKTGSTFLQWEVFRNIEDVNFIFRQKEFRYLLAEIRNINKNINISYLRTIMTKLLDDEKPNLISNENLYSNMFLKYDDRFFILNRIKEIFPNSKVILGIRNKKNLLLSLYKEYVAMGGVLEFDEFLEKKMNLRKLDYEPYIERLKELFGDENVLIFRQEDLVRDERGTIKRICDFIGAKVPDYKRTKRNVSYGMGELRAALVLNRFFRSKHNEKGIPYPYNDFLLPHRIFFQSRLLAWIPRKKVTLEDLVKKEKTWEILEEWYGTEIR